MFSSAASTAATAVARSPSAGCSACSPLLLGGAFGRALTALGPPSCATTPTMSGGSGPGTRAGLGSSSSLDKHVHVRVLQYCTNTMDYGQDVLQLFVFSTSICMYRYVPLELLTCHIFVIYFSAPNSKHTNIYFLAGRVYLKVFMTPVDLGHFWKCYLFLPLVKYLQAALHILDCTICQPFTNIRCLSTLHYLCCESGSTSFREASLF